MAIEVYGCTPPIVLKSMGGIDRDSVAADTDPSTADFEEWIEDGAAEIAGVIAAQSLGTSDVNAQRMFRNAIRAYAKARAYEHFNRPESMQRALDEYEALLARVRDLPSEVKGGYSGQIYKTNVNQTDPHKKQFEKRDKNNIADGGFDGW